MKTSMGARPLLYPTPVMVVGSYDAGGRANAMTAAWGGVACSEPPCISVSLRAATATHGNILARRAFTISLPSEEHAAQADYLGLASGRDHDKFRESGLTAVASSLVDAPYIAEFPIVLECALVGVHELGLHTLFVGEVRDAKIDDELLDEHGQVRIEALRPILYAVAPKMYYAFGAPLGKAFSIGKIFGA